MLSVNIGNADWAYEKLLQFHAVKQITWDSETYLYRDVAEEVVTLKLVSPPIDANIPITILVNDCLGFSAMFIGTVWTICETET